MRNVAEAIVISCVALWLAFTVTFVLLRVVPTNALMARISQSELNTSEAAQLIAAYGMDRPVWEQYFSQIASYLRGDFGRSFRTGQPVALLVQRRLQNTLELTAIVSAASIVFSLALAFAGWHSRVVRRVAHIASAASLALPVYWTGILALMTVGAWFRLPQSAVILPISALTFHLTAQMSKMFVDSLHHAARQPFVAFARSKGLRDSLLWWRYVVLPTSPALMTFAGTQLIILMGSTITMEVLFSRPGLGSMLVDAVIARDYPVVQGVIVILTTFSIVINMICDALSKWIDPRMRAL